MDNYTKGPLKILVNKSGKEIIMSWTGKSAENKPQGSISPYLNGLIEDLKENRLKIEFEKLKFMNTSTFTVMILFLRELNTNGIKTVVTYDRSAYWQHISFKGIEALARTMKYVTIQGV
ncbi:MAG: hypothetical protein GY795_11340 [Desulfobacterales bacterium]|nr:hypothetical protein [Desulfobacterales bacterium]